MSYNHAGDILTRVNFGKLVHFLLLQGPELLADGGGPIEFEDAYREAVLMMQCTKFDESLDNTVMETAADFEAKVREVH